MPNAHVPGRRRPYAEPGVVREVSSSSRRTFRRAGELSSCTGPLAPYPDPFQMALWTELTKTRTEHAHYGDIAAGAGSGLVGRSRAVGRPRVQPYLGLVLPAG